MYYDVCILLIKMPEDRCIFLLYRYNVKCGVTEKLLPLICFNLIYLSVIKVKSNFSNN